MGIFRVLSLHVFHRRNFTKEALLEGQIHFHLQDLHHAMVQKEALIKALQKYEQEGGRWVVIGAGLGRMEKKRALEFLEAREKEIQEILKKIVIEEKQSAMTQKKIRFMLLNPDLHRGIRESKRY